MLNAVRDVAFEDRAIPELTNDTDVLIRIEVTGICGSDVSAPPAAARRAPC